MKDICVLITACGSQYAPELVNCIKDNGERKIRVVGVDCEQDDSVLEYTDAFYQVPKVSDNGYVDRLISICKSEEVDILLPCISDELIKISQRLNDFEKINTKVSISSQDSIKITTNKYELYKFMQDNSLYTPKFVKINKKDDINNALEYLGYPQKAVCFKALDKSGSRGIRIVDDRISKWDMFFNYKPNSLYISLQELLSIFQDENNTSPIMAMEYLSGVEGSVDLIAENGKILYMAYRESTVNLHSIPQEGILKDNPKAYEIATSVIGALKYDGIADLDFKNDEKGNPVLLELNPRMSATMRVFKEGGLNLPYLRIKQLLQEKLPKVNIEYGIKFKRRYREMYSK